MLLKRYFTIILLVSAILLSPHAVNGQIADSPDESVADIPVNYTEAKV